MKIDWEEVWDTYNNWLMKRKDVGYCPNCGFSGFYPTWKEQQRRIRQLVNKQLGKKK